MTELVYSAGLTSKLFWLQESRKTASYILEDYSKAGIRKIAWEENIYQVKAEYCAYEVLNGTYRGVSALPEAVLQMLTTCDVVAGWTDTAVRKWKQCFTRMMFEAGLLESSAKPTGIDLDDGVKVNYAKFQGVEVAPEGKKALKVDSLAKI